MTQNHVGGKFHVEGEWRPVSHKLWEGENLQFFSLLIPVDPSEMFQTGVFEWELQPIDLKPFIISIYYGRPRGRIVTVSGPCCQTSLCLLFLCLKSLPPHPFFFCCILWQRQQTVWPRSPTGWDWQEELAKGWRCLEGTRGGRGHTFTPHKATSSCWCSEPAPDVGVFPVALLGQCCL